MGKPLFHDAFTLLVDGPLFLYVQWGPGAAVDFCRCVAVDWQCVAVGDILVDEGDEFLGLVQGALVVASFQSNDQVLSLSVLVDGDEMDFASLGEDCLGALPERVVHEDGLEVLHRAEFAPEFELCARGHCC